MNSEADSQGEFQCTDEIHLRSKPFDKFETSGISLNIYSCDVMLDFLS